MTRGPGPARFFVHTATVRTFLGENGLGADTFATTDSAAGFFDGGSKLVRDKDGQTIAAAAMWYTSVADAAIYTLDTVVVVNGVTGRVVAIESHTSGSLGLPDHLAVALV